MDEPGVYAALGEIFQEVFGRPIQLRPDLTAADVPGWDSFKQIEILVASEEQFGFNFSSREIDNLRCVDDLVQVILRRI